MSLSDKSLPRAENTPEMNANESGSDNRQEFFIKNSNSLLPEPVSPEPTPSATEYDITTSPDSSESDESDFSDLDEPLDESLASTIIREIEDGTYVCLVCTCEIDRHSEIWSCQNCYRVYDLECINDWATRGSSTNAQKEWRCPACNVEQRSIPLKFTCWCGRVKNPSADNLIPFSCGNPCSVKYPHCVHACSSVCHPGKHPECGALGPVMNCKCGKHTQQLPCLVSPYKVGWKCDTPCEAVVCELGHQCSIGACHLGFCGPCEEKVEVRCYCGDRSEKMDCFKLDPKICYEKEDRGRKFVGGFSCLGKTTEYFSCGIHSVELPCQPLPASTLKCKFDAENVKTCYCGKTHVAAFARTKCTDPMPECDRVCGKFLACGCKCLAKCHEGACECYNILEVKCSCQNASYLVPCKAIQQGFQPKCHHKCTAALSCRKHFHREKCCEFEQMALSRERELKKQLRNRVRSNFEDQISTMEPIHICTRTCNQLKPCGLHYCEALCHSGPCGVCLESSPEDLVCHCGKTVIPAPVRCGTKLVCQEQCVREKECGHPPEPHRCHDDTKPCLRCTKLVTKRCNCGEKELKNILCSVDSVSCGKICNERLECGHVCNTPCSRSCVEGKHANVASCRLPCRKIRKSCPHMCMEKCHFASKKLCDAKKCTESVSITCGCGRVKKVVQCGALSALPTKIGTVIPCDEDCAQSKREEELKAIFTGASQEFHNPYSEETLSVYKRQVNWCLKMETIVRTFVSDYIDCVAADIPTKKSIHFPPMSKPQRQFIHNLAEAYKLYSESQDREPLRSVFVCVTTLSVMTPITIRQALEKEDELEQKRLKLEELKLSELDDALFNAILVQDVFFGVYQTDVEKNVRLILENYPDLKDWLVKSVKQSTFAFYDKHFAEMDKTKENELYMLLKTFKKVMRDNLIAFDCKMCMVNEDGDYVLKVDLKNVNTSTSLEENDDNSNNMFSVLQGQEVEG